MACNKSVLQPREVHVEFREGRPKKFNKSAEAQDIKYIETLQASYANLPSPPKRTWDKLRIEKAADGECTIHELRDAPSKPDTHVLTNHFPVKLSPGLTLWVYSISIKKAPEKVSKAKRRVWAVDIIDKIGVLKDNATEIATDYANTIFSFKDLGITSAGINTEITSHEPGGRKESQLPVTVALSHTVDVDTFLQHIDEVDDIQAASFDKSGIIAALNAFLFKCIDRSASSKYVAVGGNKMEKIYSKNSCVVPSMDPFWCSIRGYTATIKPCMNNLLLQMNTLTSLSYVPKRVSDFIGDPPSAVFQDMLKGVRVRLDRGHKEKSPYRTVCGYADLPPGQQMFINDKKKEISVWQNAKNKYPKARIHAPKDSTIPCVNIGSREKGQEIFVPAEHLVILPYQIYRKAVPMELTDWLMNEACRGPVENLRYLMDEGLQALDIQDHNYEVGLGLDNKMTINPNGLQVGALRYQNQITLKYAENKKASPNPLAQWNLRHKTLKSPGTIRSVDQVAVLIEYKNDLWDSSFDREEKANEFLTAAATYGIPKYGLQQLGSDNAIFAEALTAKTFTDHSSGIEARLDAAYNMNAHLVIFMMAKQDPKAYSAFKTQADWWGLHSICITQRPFLMSPKGKKPDEQEVWANIALKFNLKLGGVNHTVHELSDVKSPAVSLKDTLVLGADVTHPGPRSKEGTTSIAACVALLDDTCGRASGQMRLQGTPRTEMIDELQSMVNKLISLWAKKNKKLPKSILYYRDGVSEGQYSQVRVQELQQIRAAFSELYPDDKVPAITAIVVAKRHHTRFFPKKKEDRAGNLNCLPGTLVDSSVTSPYYMDFYLQSHHGPKGTAKPTHYFVLEDGMKLGAAKVQLLTHQICYTYVRATIGVSYASPAYYADRLCERGRAYLRNFFVGRNDAEFRDLTPEDVRGKMDNAWEDMCTQWKNGTAEKHDNPWHPDFDDKIFWM